MGMETTDGISAVELVKYLREHMEERLDRQDKAIAEIKEEIKEGRKEVANLARQSQKTNELISAGKLGGAFLKWLIGLGVGIAALVAAIHGGK